MARRTPVLPPRSGGGRQPFRDPRPNHALRAVSLAATGVTFLLVAVGALVRATGSGEGCSGWPKCSATSWLPPLAYHAIIEYSHRMTAFVDIVLIGVLAVVATRRYRHVPRVFRTAWLAVALVFAQAALGAIVVKGDLAALLVTAHFGTAMILTAVLVYVSVAAFSVDVRVGGRVDPFTWLATATAGATFALMAVGAYVRGEDAGLAFPDWPLMNGRVLPRLASTPQALNFTHRLLALLVGILVVVLAFRARGLLLERRPAATLAWIAAGIFVAQVFAGAANVWTKLAQPAVVSHVALAGLLWGALVATAAASRVCACAVKAGRRAPVPPAEAARAGSAA